MVSTNTISMVTGTGMFTAITPLALGNETPARDGNPLRKSRVPVWNNTPSATVWVNSGSTTSGRLAVDLATLAVVGRRLEAISVEGVVVAEVATAAEVATVECNL